MCLRILCTISYESRLHGNHGPFARESPIHVGHVEIVVVSYRYFFRSRQQLLKQRLVAFAVNIIQVVSDGNHVEDGSSTFSFVVHQNWIEKRPVT